MKEFPLHVEGWRLKPRSSQVYYYKERKNEVINNQNQIQNKIVLNFVLRLFVVLVLSSECVQVQACLIIVITSIYYEDILYLMNIFLILMMLLLI